MAGAPSGRDESERASAPEEGGPVYAMTENAAATDWAQDGELADEIVLYGDVVVAASESDEDLTQVEIDTALGLDESAEDEPPQG